MVFDFIRCRTKEVNTLLETRILEILQAAGDKWLRLGEIAKSLGRKSQMTPYDKRVLRRLLAQGLVESRRLNSERESYLYRIKQEITQTAPSSERGSVN
jgi:hypothetical protein